MKRCTLLLLLLACTTQAPIVRSAHRDEAFFCHYKKGNHHLQHGTFSLTPNGPPVMTFAERRARPTGVELWVPWGAGHQPIRGVFTTGWVAYALYLKTSRPFVIYPKEPVQLGVLELGSSAALEYVGTEGSGMRARVKPHDEFRSVRPMELSLKCTETSIVSAFRWPAEQTDGGPLQEVALVEEQDIPVSLTPGGTTDGVLHLKKDSWPKHSRVLEEQPEYVRIVRTMGSARVVGWISRQLVKPPAEMDRVVGGLGMLGSAGEGAGKPAWSRCAAAVPLYLLHDGRLHEAGKVMAKAAYEVVVQTSQWAQIRLPENDWLELEPGYAWAFKAGDLEVCQTKQQ